MTRPPILATRYGSRVNLRQPDPKSILLPDIAYALTHIHRYGGHGHPNYTVADHCVNLAAALPSHRLDALLHDAAEAYIGDIPSPLRALLPPIRGIERRLMQAIYQAFGLSLRPNPIVAAFDTAMLYLEEHLRLAPPGLCLPCPKDIGLSKQVDALISNNHLPISVGITEHAFYSLLRKELGPTWPARALITEDW